MMDGTPSVKRRTWSDSVNISVITVLSVPCVRVLGSLDSLPPPPDCCLE